MATVLGKVRCSVCDFSGAIVSEAKAGALAVHCPECKSQAFARSPKAAATLRARLAEPREPIAPIEKPAPDKPKGKGGAAAPVPAPADDFAEFVGGKA